MPRYARRQSASSIYHIMLRGNERKEIFLDDQDRNRFLDILMRMKEDRNYHLYAYCLMNNHIHLLIHEDKDTIQRSMKRISVSYVHYFNQKYRRIGHLFQDRYRSEAVEDESYVMAAASYIHNNPVKSRLVPKASEFVWSSYRQYINLDPRRKGLVDTNFILSMLSDDQAQAVHQLQEYTGQHLDGSFIDYEEAKPVEILTVHLNLAEEIEQVLGKKGETLQGFRNCKDKELRNRLLKDIKEATGASVRSLSEALGISKDIIFRA